MEYNRNWHALEHNWSRINTLQCNASPTRRLTISSIPVVYIHLPCALSPMDSAINSPSFDNIFSARDDDDRPVYQSDEDDLDYEPSELGEAGDVDDDEMDTDSDEAAEDAGIGAADDDDGVENEFSFYTRNTRGLKSKLDGKLAERVHAVLQTMADVGLNLPLFLDAVSWGSDDCVQDARIRYARSSLMNSEELPGILRRWWKPPRSKLSGKSRTQAANVVVEAFA